MWPSGPPLLDTGSLRDGSARGRALLLPRRGVLLLLLLDKVEATRSGGVVGVGGWEDGAVEGEECIEGRWRRDRFGGAHLEGCLEGCLDGWGGRRRGRQA